VTIARWDADSMELLALGDSPAVAYLAGREQEPTVLLDDRLEPIGAPLRQKYRQYLRDGHGYDDEFSALLAELQRAELAQRNRPGGYWSAEADPAAAAQSLTRRYDLDDVQAVLLLTDGASAAVDTYGRPATWRQVLHDVQKHGAATVLDHVHELEDSDPRGRRWPRSKAHDDKTLAFMRPRRSGTSPT
jgi:hypothetical protein